MLSGKRTQGFNTAAQDSNPGPLSRESEVLPLSHCALQMVLSYVCHLCNSNIRTHQHDKPFEGPFFKFHRDVS